MIENSSLGLLESLHAGKYETETNHTLRTLQKHAYSNILKIILKIFR